MKIVNPFSPDLELRRILADSRINRAGNDVQSQGVRVTEINCSEAEALVKRLDAYEPKTRAALYAALERLGQAAPTAGSRVLEAINAEAVDIIQVAAKR